MLLQNALQDYFENIKLAVLFGTLLVFVFFFLLLPNIIVGSGSIFLEYNLENINLFSFAVTIFTFVVFMVFYSMFISFVIFNVRNKLNPVRLQYYLKDKIHKFSFALFVFFLAFSFLLFFLGVILLALGIPVIAINVLFLILSLLLLFVPQSIVIDEHPLWHCVLNGIEYMRKFPLFAAYAVIFSIVLLAILPLIELLIDYLTPELLLGKYISIIILLVFVVPFIECLKARLYMMKFGLVQPHA